MHPFPREAIHTLFFLHIGLDSHKSITIVVVQWAEANRAWWFLCCQGVGLSVPELRPLQASTEPGGPVSYSIYQFLVSERSESNNGLKSLRFCFLLP